jgi:hypothetical protein
MAASDAVRKPPCLSWKRQATSEITQGSRPITQGKPPNNSAKPPNNSGEAVFYLVKSMACWEVELEAEGRIYRGLTNPAVDNSLPAVTAPGSRTRENLGIMTNLGFIETDSRQQMAVW